MSTFFSKLLTRMRRRKATAPSEEHSDDHLRDVFALQVQAVLNVVGLPSEYHPETFSLRVDHSDSAWNAYLANQFFDYVHAAPSDRERVVLHVARGIRDANHPTPIAVHPHEARAHLRPRIRHRAQQFATRLRGGEAGEGVFVPVSTDLVAEVVYDTPANIVGLPVEALAWWGMSAEQALGQAVNNLRLSADAPFRSCGDGVWAAVVGDNYDSARLLLTDDIARLPVHGAPVALPANRDTLFVTGTRNLGGLYRMLEVAVDALDRPRVDTLQPVVLTHGAWRDWLPAPSHPMWEAFYELAVITRGERYAAVQQLLADQHTHLGRDLFVASYGVLVPSNGEQPQSHAVWPPTPGWLPEADLVTVIHPHDERYIVVPWPKLRQVAHLRLRRVPEVFPPYFAFDGAPDRDLWERLRVHAVREGVVDTRRKVVSR